MVLINLKTKQMKKSDLKTGMIVEERSGTKLVVLKGTECGDIISQLDGKGFNDFDDLDENLICNNDEYSINKIYIFTPSLNTNCGLLWERKEETFIELDGIEYSESTLRSIIKKSLDS